MQNTLVNDLLEKLYLQWDKAPISEWKQTITSKQWNYSSELLLQNCAESGNRPLKGLPVTSYFRGRLSACRCRKKILPKPKFMRVKAWVYL